MGLATSALPYNARSGVPGRDQGQQTVPDLRWYDLLRFVRVWKSMLQTTVAHVFFFRSNGPGIRLVAHFALGQ